MRHFKKPWGSFDLYTLNEASTVKIITVKPGARTSLQSHKNRKEFWVALDKGLAIQVRGKKMPLKKGSTTTVEREVKHRICCDGLHEARLLEISFGNFLENDIERYEDDYGRLKKRTPP